MSENNRPDSEQKKDQTTAEDIFCTGRFDFSGSGKFGSSAAVCRSGKT